VTEEQSESHNVGADRFIIVDALDGTKKFVHRRGDFIVNIALIENGTPVLGVVFAPANKRLFYTDASGQTVEESLDGTIKPLNVSTPNNDALIVVASKSHRDAATDDYINKYKVADSAAAVSSLKFCLVAAGEADLYPRLGRTMERDTAAGHSVLLGAGGYVARFDDHSPLTYGKPIYENPLFTALHFLRDEKFFGPEDALFPKPERRLEGGKFVYDKLSQESYSNAQKINQIVRTAFANVQMHTYTPHSFRKTLGLLMNDLELTLEQQKAWSQNMGHENFTTTVSVVVRRIWTAC